MPAAGFGSFGHHIFLAGLGFVGAAGRRALIVVSDGTDTESDLGLEEVAQIYRDVLSGPQDDETRLHISHRLADIEMLGAEERLAASAAAEPDFAGAITAYETLLRDNPDPSEHDVRLALTGNLCRCTGYAGMVAAALAVARRRRGEVR